MNIAITLRTGATCNSASELVTETVAWVRVCVCVCVCVVLVQIVQLLPVPIALRQITRTATPLEQSL